MPVNCGFWQTAQGTADMKLVGLAVQTGEPRDELSPDGRFPYRRRKYAVVLDRQRIEAWVTGFVQIKSARANQPPPAMGLTGAEQRQCNRRAVRATAQQSGPARRRQCCEK